MHGAYLKRVGVCEHCSKEVAHHVPRPFPIAENVVEFAAVKPDEIVYGREVGPHEAVFTTTVPFIQG
jgi:hypothetical protein